MNILQRRQFVRGRMIDAVVAKAPVSNSRRERTNEVRALRKAMAVHRAAAVKRDAPAHAVAINN